MSNAGFLRRLGAMFYDSLLALALMFLATLPFVAAYGGEPVPADNMLYSVITGRSCLAVLRNILVRLRAHTRHAVVGIADRNGPTAASRASAAQALGFLLRRSLAVCRSVSAFSGKLSTARS